MQIRCFSEHPGDENFQSDADKDDTAQDIRLAGKLCAELFADTQACHADKKEIGRAHV